MVILFVGLKIRILSSKSMYSGAKSFNRAFCFVLIEIFIYLSIGRDISDSNEVMSSSEG